MRTVYTKLFVEIVLSVAKFLITKNCHKSSRKRILCNILVLQILLCKLQVNLFLELQNNLYLPQYSRYRHQILHTGVSGRYEIVLKISTRYVNALATYSILFLWSQEPIWGTSLQKFSHIFWCWITLVFFTLECWKFEHVFSTSWWYSVQIFSLLSQTVCLPEEFKVKVQSLISQTMLLSFLKIQKFTTLSVILRSLPYFEKQ